MNTEEIKQAYDDFDKVCNWFKETKYGNLLNVYNEPIYDFAIYNVKGDIFFAFCTKHIKNHLESSYIYINGKIAIDTSESFDKMRNCIFHVDLPNTKDEFDGIIDLFDFVQEKYDLIYDETKLDTIKALESYKRCKQMIHLIDWEI